MSNGDFEEKIGDHEVVGLGASSEYVSHTDADIKQLALDWLGGGLFGSWMIREDDVHLLGCIFMPLLFMDEIQHKQIIRDGVVHFYERISKAGPRSINGYPIFMSMGYIDTADMERLLVKVKQIQEL